ncbi:threonine--tRNA ligase [Thermoclostridium stercorarium subsp. leptospartum DSM 9219]|uniref:Threonine--tRNA ligase n=1 Tax=Thermoclostridium stercorarium subsp. leptospartum DSM 9219 TaxID=1346611 RepID=A0A1B1YL94_THEST|nr:threonine--tRNA ligase [Thermoclostridium stercorarium]ANX01557.1 threonine--tRNA ligase [Thermoclostridium stercorarium subsp. leptospartum DSM 9219]
MAEINERLHKVKNTMVLVLACAVGEIFGSAKLGTGTVSENEFFYDFELPRPLVPEDLELIENKIVELINKGYQITKESVDFDKARNIFSGQPYKLELLGEICKNSENPQIPVCKIGEFYDLCGGPVLSSLKELNLHAFKLLSFSGAYWKGDAGRPMLQRIYGTAWESKEELKTYISKIEEASKRDHRILGKQLDFFSFSQDVGQGLVLWHPKGAMVRYLLEKFSQTAHVLNGYEWVYTPHIGRAELWKTSGHLQFYKDSMYNPIEIDNEKYYLKPMSCPFHVMIYNSSVRSYRDLPIRYAEYAAVYRYELSGTLHGLTRVRGFTQDDAHIICTPEQANDEIFNVLKFSLYILQSFGLNDFKAYIATRPENKSIGSTDDWNRATEILKSAVIRAGLEYQIDEGGGAFYGPKIDLKLRDALGREWQCSTIQFDFNLPERFNMKYVGADGLKHTPLMVHRALFGSMERFFAMLIEHYNGEFPLWLAPVQIGIVPVSSRNNDYCKDLSVKLKKSGLRVSLDSGDDKMNAKIRKMEMEKTPIIFVVGDREIERKGFSVRSRKEGNLGFITFESFMEKIKPELDMGVPRYIMN